MTGFFGPQSPLLQTTISSPSATAMGVKETLCTSCGHRQVCSLTDTFLKVQEAVDSISVGTGNNGIIRVVDLKWCGITINCTHFEPKNNIRKGELL